eukprot:TRINITY_DN5064_c2_g1_i1.p1 TRINITY_DN5064_c2_g1~~TRINITY_DN5064_c2_g1_i1.p1  ORF type:complete len:372 (+),score=65.83 TRINITY_DN5064_c2_g1_i1:2-1117(+)
MAENSLAESLSRVLLELESLAAIYGDDCEIEAGAAAELELLVQGENLEDNTLEQILIARNSLQLASLQIDISRKGGGGSDAPSSAGLKLHVIIPHFYLRDPACVPLVWVDIAVDEEHRFLSSQQLSSLGYGNCSFPHEELQNFVDELSAKETAQEVLLDIAQCASDLVEMPSDETDASIPADDDAEDQGLLADLNNYMLDDDSCGASIPSRGRQQQCRKLGRRLMYSHHILASTKRQLIKEWADHLDLGGFSKIGYPGVVIIEGSEEACEIYVNAISRLRWKYFCVRGEEIVEAPASISDVNELRKLPRRFVELGHNDMSILASECRKYDCEDLFKTCMKIYAGSSQSTGDGTSATKKGPKSKITSSKSKT